MPQRQPSHDSFESFATPGAAGAAVVLIVDAGRRRGWWRTRGASLPAAIHQAMPNAVVETHAERRISSVKARRAAVARLRQRLRHLTTTAQRRPVFVATHGHGGSLVLRSLQEESLDGRVDGVICLGTPFVYVWRRQLGPLLTDLVCALPVFVFAAWLAAAAALFAAGFLNRPGLAFAAGGALVAATIAMLTVGRTGRALRAACDRMERDASQLAALPTLRQTPLLVLSTANEGVARLPWPERMAQAALAELGRTLGCSAAVVTRIGATLRTWKARSVLMLSLAGVGGIAVTANFAGVATVATLAVPLASVAALIVAVLVAFVVATVCVTMLATVTFVGASLASMRQLPSFGPERLVHRLFASVSADRVPFGFPGVSAPPLSTGRTADIALQAQALAVDWIHTRTGRALPPGANVDPIERIENIAKSASVRGTAAARPKPVVELAVSREALADDARVHSLVRPEFVPSPRPEFIAPTAWLPAGMAPAALASHAS